MADPTDDLTPNPPDAPQDSTPPSAPSGTPDDYVHQAYQHYLSIGYPPQAAAAMASNSAHEGPDSSTQKGDGGQAFGRFQWHPDRQANLRAFAKATGGDPNSDTTQWNFADHEMGSPFATDGGRPNVAGFGSEGTAGKLLANAKDPNAANDAVLSFLRPAGFNPKTGDVSGVPSRQSRLDMTNGVLGLGPMPASPTAVGAGAGANPAMAQGPLPQGGALNPGAPPPTDTSAILAAIQKQAADNTAARASNDQDKKTQSNLKSAANGLQMMAAAAPKQPGFIAPGQVHRPQPAAMSLPGILQPPAAPNPNIVRGPSGPANPADFYQQPGETAVDPQGNGIAIRRKVTNPWDQYLGSN
jgi:hypothetical protein